MKHHRLKLKSQARALLWNARSSLALLTASLLLFNILLSHVLDSVFAGGAGTWNFILNIVCTALANVVYYILLAGQQRIYLSLCQNHTVRMNDLFFAFSQPTEAVAVYSLIPFALESACATLYSLALTTVLFDSLSAGLLYVAAFLAVAALSRWIHLCFFPLLFLYQETPWERPAALMRRSLRMMRGFKWKLFCLELSFLGLDLLCLLSLGIGYLFAEPYRQTTLTLFYLDMQGAQSQI